MKFISIFILFTLSLPIFASERAFDDALSIEKQSDGLFKVTCADKSIEILDTFNIMDNNLCPHIVFDPKKQDILFVVDDSASMMKLQTKLSAHAGLMLEKLKLRNIDYRIAVTTTSNAKKNKGYNAPSGTAIIDSNTADAKNLLEQNLLAGDKGEPFEKHFSSALSLLTSENFLREHSNLHIVFFSDEDEQSNITITSFLETLRKITHSGPKKDKFQITNVHVLDRDCHKTKGGGSWPYSNFEELNKYPGTKAVNICDEVLDIF